MENTNMEQKINDTFELAKLTSQTLIDNSDKVISVDKNINRVGANVVDLHKLATEINDSVKQHNVSLKTLSENQDTVQTKTDDVNTSITKTTQAIESNQTLLQDIKESLSTNATDDINYQNKFIDTVKQGNSDYAVNIAAFTHQLALTEQHVADLSPQDELKSATTAITKTSEVLQSLITSEDDRKRDVGTKLDTLDARFGESLKTLTDLTTSANTFNSQLNTAIGRMNAVEVQVGALVSQENAPVDTSDEESLSATQNNDWNQSHDINFRNEDTRDDK